MSAKTRSYIPNAFQENRDNIFIAFNSIVKVNNEIYRDAFIPDSRLIVFQDN